VGQMLRQVWGLCGKIMCTKAVLLIIRVCIIWINLHNEGTCYLIYWTALICRVRSKFDVTFSFSQSFRGSNIPLNIPITGYFQYRFIPQTQF
jgi:hypothetical protein